jgi:hypothetical protein
MLEGYFIATTKAIGTLFKEGLLPHSLVIIYSTIDTCGLLDAPATQTEATGESFKNWVKKYILTDPALEFNEVDLWGARCAVLHTFTSQSRLSNEGKARQLQYYTGDKSQPHIQNLIAFTKSHENGAHLPVHYGDLAEAVFTGMKAFVPDLAAICATSPDHLARLRKIVQTYMHEPAPNSSFEADGSAAAQL